MGIIQMMVLLLLKRSNIKLSRDIYFAATADEERESNFGVIQLLKTAPELQHPGYVITEGGGGMRGVLADNSKVVWGIGIGEKVPLFLNLTVHGRAGHGSQPASDNPNEILITAINNVISQKARQTSHPLIEEMIKILGELPDNKFANALTKNTVSVTSVRGGVGDPPQPNVIPSSCSATLDCRLLPGIDPNEYLSGLTNLLNDERIKISPVKLTGQSSVSTSETDLYRIIKETAEEKIPASLTVPLIVPYATDSRYMREKGFVCYGFTPFISSLDDLSLMHSDNERIDIESFVSGVELLYDIVVKFCGE